MNTEGRNSDKTCTNLDMHALAEPFAKIIFASCSSSSMRSSAPTEAAASSSQRPVLRLFRLWDDGTSRDKGLPVEFKHLRLRVRIDPGRTWVYRIWTKPPQSQGLNIHLRSQSPLCPPEGWGHSVPRSDTPTVQRTDNSTSIQTCRCQRRGFEVCQAGVFMSCMLGKEAASLASPSSCEGHALQ